MYKDKYALVVSYVNGKAEKGPMVRAARRSLIKIINEDKGMFSNVQIM